MNQNLKQNHENLQKTVVKNVPNIFANKKINPINSRFKMYFIVYEQSSSFNHLVFRLIICLHQFSLVCWQLDHAILLNGKKMNNTTISSPRIIPMPGDSNASAVKTMKNDNFVTEDLKVEPISIRESKRGEREMDRESLITCSEVEYIIQSTGHTRFGELQRIITNQIGRAIGFPERKVISIALRAAYCAAAEMKRSADDKGCRGVLMFTAYTEDYVIGIYVLLRHTH